MLDQRRHTTTAHSSQTPLARERSLARIGSRHRRSWPSLLDTRLKTYTVGEFTPRRRTSVALTYSTHQSGSPSPHFAVQKIPDHCAPGLRFQYCHTVRSPRDVSCGSTRKRAATLGIGWPLQGTAENRASPARRSKIILHGYRARAFRGGAAAAPTPCGQQVVCEIQTRAKQPRTSELSARPLNVGMIWLQAIHACRETQGDILHPTLLATRIAHQ